MRRRNLMALAALTPGLAQAQAAIALWTAGPGSAFLPYGEGLARHLARTGITTEVKQSAGSLQNLGAVESDANAIGTAFLGSVWDALEGAPNAGGHRHVAIRALFPMYETAFMVAAPAASGLRTIRDLAGKRVGAGPARGPAEGFFRVAAAVAGIEPVVVSGDPAALAEALLRGEIDALWQGAAVPIPALTMVADRSEAVIFGLTPAELAEARRRLPYMAESTVAPGTYRGQSAPVLTFSAWNFVVGNWAMPEPVAYALTRAALSAEDPRVAIHPSAIGTRAANAPANAILAFHPGAARFYAEQGVTLAAPPG
ncbi:TAXI family TRAP transporter solute-binding subunit [Plastoroseomonas arctica]|uniref:TAXI family TRAP transporter solute-binding subunit n=1 Tax=Plastoroseomonas arctica TaxID=1509237 RepID=A0AAF1KL51_9PROT|nr:TAXI family TRAP transporter solute-binding subunit [Plastoroseomonas arctica]MBR0654326.1 TAXI family TRAP transporter solute-binding subunit [Plastoroseomonas arctica]